MRFRRPKINGPLLLVFLVLVLLMPRAAKFSYDYRKGSPWAYETLIAQFDFPVLKTVDQLAEEIERADDAVVPCYRYSEDVAGTVAKALDGLDFGAYPSLRSPLLAQVNRMYLRGILSDARPKMGTYDTVSEEVLLIQRGKRAEKVPFSEVYRLSDARARLLATLEKAAPAVPVDSVLRAAGVYDALVPNLVFDKGLTERMRADASGISPTSGYVSADQKIVSAGEIVTAEIAQVLDSYKAEYERNLGYDGPRFLLWLGNILLALALVLVLLFSICYANPQIFHDQPRYLYLLTVFVLAVLTEALVARYRPGLLYLVPFTVFTLYLQAFFRRRVVLPVYTASLLPLLVLSSSGVEFFVMYLAAGVCSMYAFQYFNRGWKQFITALVVFGVLVSVYTGFRLAAGGAFNIAYAVQVLYLFLGSMLSVLFYPLTYLFEKVFNLVSQSRLEELADIDNRLLRDLAKKAPGTFQHCLQVMNMADAAARAIDADVALTRAGALYHDIGKMNNPLCFVENEGVSGHKYHEGLTPLQSAKDIIRHVPDGIELAAKNKLPEVVTDFIRTHHGTSATGYFLTTYLNEGGDPDHVADFHYRWGKPSTKEQAIVMLCDTLEAASRTIKSGDPEDYSRLVDGIIESKLRDGQFNGSDISMKELHKILNVLKAYLKQLYHERIVYPKRTEGTDTANQ